MSQKWIVKAWKLKIDISGFLIKGKLLGFLLASLTVSTINFYLLFSNRRKRRLFETQTLKCGTYYRMALKRIEPNWSTCLAATYTVQKLQNNWSFTFQTSAIKKYMTFTGWI